MYNFNRQYMSVLCKMGSQRWSFHFVAMRVTLSALVLWCTLEWYSCCEVVRIFAGTGNIPMFHINWTMVTILTKWAKEEVRTVMYFSCAKCMSVWETTVSTERLLSRRIHDMGVCVNLLNSWRLEIHHHLPCSPDLALLDFHPFPKIAKRFPKSALPDW